MNTVIFVGVLMILSAFSLKFAIKYIDKKHHNHV